MVEIHGNIYGVLICFSTDFSDDTTRIAKIFMRRNGTALYSSYTVTAGGSEKLATLELDENPLLSALTDDEVKTALNNLLAQLYLCLNRVFDAEFTGDPALEVGDYVRLRGGAIDTERGYATGMITSQIWRYRGQHTIKCTMPSSLSAAEDTAVQTYALGENSSDTNAAPVRTQPKSQLQKQIDELRANQAGGTAEKLHTKGKQYYAKTDSSGVSFGKGGDDGSEAKFAFIAPGDSGDGFKLSAYGPYNIDVSGKGFSIANAFNAVMNVSTSGATFFEVFSSGETSRFKVDSGGKFHVHVGSITFAYGNYTYSFSRTADGWAIDCDAFQEGRRLEAKGDGLYYNGKRLLTEEDLK